VSFTDLFVALWHLGPGVECGCLYPGVGVDRSTWIPAHVKQSRPRTSSSPRWLPKRSLSNARHADSYRILWLPNESRYNQTSAAPSPPLTLRRRPVPARSCPPAHPSRRVAQVRHGHRIARPGDVAQSRRMIFPPSGSSAGPGPVIRFGGANLPSRVRPQSGFPPSAPGGLGSAVQVRSAIAAVWAVS